MRLLKSLSDAGCRKPGCMARTGILHRHHKRHQAMWKGIWATLRKDDLRFQKFCKRYEEFHPDDIVRLCDRHHSEIHWIYDQIIQQDRRKLGKSLSRYTWKEAERLMDKLEKACEIWLRVTTSGISNKTLLRRRKQGPGPVPPKFLAPRKKPNERRPRGRAGNPEDSG